jgi:hypothetical protein
MKRVFRIAVLSIFGLALANFPTPAQAADHGYYGEQEYNHTRYVRNDRGDARGYSNRYSDNRYRQNDRYYDRGAYRDRDSHAGRSAAIIGGSAAAGAVIGAAAGHGQGAAIGAVVGGIAGFIADQSVRHHDRR